MFKIDVTVEGMMCGNCESHVNQAIKEAFPDVVKVKSSRKKNLTEIISERHLDPERITGVIVDTGYKVGEIQEKPYEKKGLFG